ncbi:psbP domain-containing protein 4, chloroplastic [Rutidosis leptorrhynchoides]|uniref:psbP domain-containing protein 4, chloroplastic n=1 Tax=Rutidosis leptorrhynchoides TaxID=125765 RepID=UPI003A9A5E13
MGTIGFTNFGFSLKPNKQKLPAHSVVASCSPDRVSTTKTDADLEESGNLGRRNAIVSGVSLVSLSVLGFPKEGVAVVNQGLLAGRIPGLSEPNEEGWRTYRRPDEKSGGHGVGWSPIIPYAFSVPDGWEETPVSIADLGGTEIDLRFSNPSEGRISVVVAPVLRFADYLEDDARIEKIGPPEKVINAFGPEVIGQNVEGKVMNSQVKEYSGRKYYQFELEPPHCLITATAAGNRLYLFSILANGLQWKRHNQELKKIADSFRIA